MTTPTAKKIPPVLSIDWLQLNCRPLDEVPHEFHDLTEPDALTKTPNNFKSDKQRDFFLKSKNPKYSKIFQVKRQHFSTQVFSVIEEIWYNSKRWATIVRKPFSKVLDPNLILIKFDNWFLYRTEVQRTVPKLLSELGLEFKAISRIDLCSDFVEFDNGMNPENFVRRFLADKILRYGKTSFSTFGSHSAKHEHRNRFETLRFGTVHSDVATYLYNKTKEMNDKINKPWIRALWDKHGMDTTKDVWRLEFSIKSSNKTMVNQETGEFMPMNSIDILKPEMQRLVYAIMINKYWKFYHNDGQKKKSRMKEVKCFAREFENYVLTDNEEERDSSRTDKIFIRKLEKTNQELRDNHPELSLNGKSLMAEFIHQRGLKEWADKQELNKFEVERVKDEKALRAFYQTIYSNKL